MSLPSTSSISEFIKSTLTQIQEGLPGGAKIDGQIRFEMSTVVQRDKGGNLGISVLNLGADVSENQTQKVTLAIKFPTNAEIAKDAAIKAKAEEERAHSEVMKKAWDGANKSE